MVAEETVAVVEAAAEMAVAALGDLAAAAPVVVERAETFEGRNVNEFAAKKGSAIPHSDKVQPDRPAMNRIEI